MSSIDIPPVEDKVSSKVGELLNRISVLEGIGTIELKALLDAVLGDQVEMEKATEYLYRVVNGVLSYLSGELSQTFDKRGLIATRLDMIADAVMFTAYEPELRYTIPQLVAQLEDLDPGFQQLTNGRPIQNDVRGIIAFLNELDPLIIVNLET